jgi:sensor c-di-GMP phosphodiesterase-like protein
MLRVLGCDDAQGFFMSKPLDARALSAWMRANDARFDCPGTNSNTARLRSLR